MDILAKVADLISGDTEDIPIHVGEVMACWLYSNQLLELIPLLQIMRNGTEDKQLLENVDRIIGIYLDQFSTIATLFDKEQIPKPDLYPEKPKSPATLMPEYGWLKDEQYANIIAVQVAGLVVNCATNMVQSIRNDMGAMWLGFQVQLVQFSAIFKRTLKEKDWLRIPPSYNR